MSHPAPSLQTHRLILRPLALEDADQVQAVFPQWEVVKLMASISVWPYPPDGALTYIRDNALPAMAEGREWHWSIRPKEVPGRLIGIISLKATSDSNRGFWLDPAWQRQGLMTEAAAAVTDFWFDDLQQPVMRVLKAAPNIASRRISQSSGMRLIGSTDCDYPSGRFPEDAWEITRDEWHTRRGKSP